MNVHIPREMSDFEKAARDFAIASHKDQRYGDQPYEVHLQAVVDILWNCHHRAPGTLAAAWLHDTIEDCHITMEQIARVTDPKVAVIVWAVSGIDGSNRREKQTSLLWKLSDVGQWLPQAVDVKLADRIANVKASRALAIHGTSDKFRMYRKEQPAFESALRGMGSAGLWQQLRTWLTPLSSFD